MPIELAVATPAYLDMTFVGLEALPAAGEERFAGDLLRSPGGGAITAIGAQRLGLDTQLVAPLGDDLAGNFVRTALAEDEVAVGPPLGSRTPTTVVLPTGGERAMVTVDPGVRARAADLIALAPRAVAASLEQRTVIPDGALAYLTCGDDDARAYASRLPPGLAGARALIVDCREALVLTGADTPEEAVERLTGVAETAVVGMGSDGALAAVGSRQVKVEGFDTGRVVDTTGTIDLFAAALAWADLRGAEPEEALRWAVLYAALSVTAPTGAAGAATLERLLAEGAARGLQAPPQAVA